MYNYSGDWQILVSACLFWLRPIYKQTIHNMFHWLKSDNILKIYFCKQFWILQVLSTYEIAFRTL